MSDLVSYARKHNAANGEDDLDGAEQNFSVNHGVEGPTDDSDIVSARGRHVRALLSTLLLSTGTPMLLARDETGHSQGGNNNAYCVGADASVAGFVSDRLVVRRRFARAVRRATARVAPRSARVAAA